MFAIGSPKWPGLSKLSEESGEVVQIIGKLMGTGGEPMHWEGTDLRVRLQEEIADALAASDFVVAMNPELDVLAIEARRAKKLKLFYEWHKAGDPLVPSK